MIAHTTDHNTLLPISTDFLICAWCGWIDTDINRMQVNYPCLHCQKKGLGGSVYFNINVHTTIQLMSTFYQVEHPQKQEYYEQRTAIIILFCTLGEILVEAFCRELMNAENIPQHIQNLLLHDYNYTSQQIYKLFPVLVHSGKGEFERVIKQINAQYIETLKYYLQVQDRRNAFVHEGDIGSIPENMPTD